MRYIIYLALSGLVFGCAFLQNQSRKKSMEDCIIRMVESDVPIDLAQEKCSKIYKNIHIEFREKKLDKK